ncbi:hypothetical protein CFP56_000879 [Quercus suber]|uniref:Uncharacterized protein n=1 Tax=Quercus suber TaxID=58331 RepID=A0AAW0LG73_QUESU
MAGKVAKSVVKAVGDYQYPWREKLVKYKNELSKGVWGYWELGAWKPLGISARHRARLRKEVLLAGEDWSYDPERKEMRTKRKGHKSPPLESPAFFRHPKCFVDQLQWPHDKVLLSTITTVGVALLEG